MRSIIVLKCASCGAPAADSLAICPYCHKATGFRALAAMPGVEVSDSGSMRISDGAHLHIGVGDEKASDGREAGTCPFCGADAAKGDSKCSYCGARLLLERLRIARLVIEGGRMTVSGGRVEVVGRTRRKIHDAAGTNDLPALQAEVIDGDDPNFEDEKGRRPLHYAAIAGAMDTAQWLLAIGAKPSPQDEAGATPLSLAESAGHPTMIELLSIYAES